jgi:hypothetical protein
VPRFLSSELSAHPPAHALSFHTRPVWQVHWKPSSGAALSWQPVAPSTAEQGEVAHPSMSAADEAASMQLLVISTMLGCWSSRHRCPIQHNTTAALSNPEPDLKVDGTVRQLISMFDSDLNGRRASEPHSQPQQVRSQMQPPVMMYSPICKHLIRLSAAGTATCIHQRHKQQPQTQQQVLCYWHCHRGTHLRTGRSSTHDRLCSRKRSL